MKKVLILEPHLDQARVIARWLNRFPQRFHVDGGYISARRPFLRLVEYHELQPVDFNDPGSYSEYDIVLPTGADSTFGYVKAMGDIRIGEVNFSKNNLKTYDKRFMLNVVERVGVPLPALYEKIDDIDRFPVFYKSDREENRHDHRRGIAAGPETLRLIGNSEKLIFQEYISGRETWGVAFLRQGDHLRWHFGQQELLSMPFSGGSGVILERLEDQRLLDYTAAILAAVDYQGWGLAEYKFCSRRNDYVFMEINGKFWESLEFCLLHDRHLLQALFEISPPEVPVGGGMAPVNRVVFWKRFFLLPIFRQIQFLPKTIGASAVGTEQMLRFLINEKIPVAVREKLKAITRSDPNQKSKT